MQFSQTLNSEPVRFKPGSAQSATESACFMQGYKTLTAFLDNIRDFACLRDFEGLRDFPCLKDEKNSPRGVDIIKASVLVCDLGVGDYKKIFDLQKKIVSAKIDNGNIPDIILILEHFPVFTLGKRGGRENLIVSEKFLKSRNIPVVQTQRGGNITFHGPGQLILYPIVDLERAKKGVADFVYELEETMIQTAAHLGVEARRDEKNHGVWVKNAKIGSIGLSIKRGISFHGFAFNVNIDLEPFSWINPCGMSDISMTSLKKELLKEGRGPVSLPDFEEVKKELIDIFLNLN